MFDFHEAQTLTLYLEFCLRQYSEVKEAQHLNICVYIYIKRNFDIYIHTVYLRRHFYLMELDLFL